MQISAVIIAFNEEAKIADAIRSVEWADEVVVVDSESTDRTSEIASELGARVIVEKWRGFAGQKQFAVDAAANDLVLSIDADERVTPDLRDEILAIRDSGVAADGYRIPRLSTYMGREIRHGGWYPDLQLRLFDRRKARWKDVAVHESITLDEGAKLGELKGDLLHFSVDSVAHHAAMIEQRYAPLGARAKFDAGRTISPMRIAAAPVITFISNYVIKLGFLDGLPGLVIAYFAAYNVFLKNVLLLEMQDSRDIAERSPDDDNQKSR
ncbi:MAG: glycosyltransferase family 2 protein [Acidobacteriota bacterium]